MGETFSTFGDYLSDKLTILRALCTTEAVIGANDQAFFMVGGSGTPQRSQLLPAGESFGAAAPLALVDLECEVETKSQETIVMGGLPSILRREINRNIDAAIVGALDGCAQAATLDADSDILDFAAKCRVTLGEHEVPVEEHDNMFVLGTQALQSRLIQAPAFSKADYVEVKSGAQRHKLIRWAGFTWLFAPFLPGVGTARETCFVLHRHALGHAIDLMGLSIPGAVTGGIGFGTARMKAKTKHLATVLQPSGILRVTNDGTKLA